MSCIPSYAYRPTDRPIPVQSSALVSTESRARLFIGGTFFRSREQGSHTNDISIEATYDLLLMSNIVTIRASGVPVEVFTTPQSIPLLVGDPCIGGIDSLRSSINSASVYVEMLARGVDFQDLAGTDAADNCLTPFSVTSLSGGSGPPAPASPGFLDGIFTGPQRTIVIISSSEDALGMPVAPPPPSGRVKQYDGTQFVSYCNLVQGACPLDGLCTP